MRNLGGVVDRKLGATRRNVDQGADLQWPAVANIEPGPTADVLPALTPHSEIHDHTKLDVSSTITALQPRSVGKTTALSKTLTWLVCFSAIFIHIFWAGSRAASSGLSRANAAADFFDNDGIVLLAFTVIDAGLQDFGMDRKQRQLLTGLARLIEHQLCVL